MAAVISIEPLPSVKSCVPLTFRAWKRQAPRNPEKILHGYLSQLSRMDVLCSFKVLTLATKAAPPSGAGLRTAVHKMQIHPNEYEEVRSFRQEPAFKAWGQKRGLPMQDIS
eukprot:5662707-Amphidinium_carterae.1